MNKEAFRYRQIHLDFHTSELIPAVGDQFDAEEFAATLEKARVDSINIFARCHHGYVYYDSKRFPERVHPNLKNRNMLKEQIAACHKRNIRTPIYITVQWDQYTAEQHPEWLVIGPDGKQTGTPPYQAGFYRLMCVNTPYVDMLKGMVQEILETLPTDGTWFDIVTPQDCSCVYCRKGMLAKGLDPSNAAVRKRYGVEVLHKFKLDMTHFVRKFNQDCVIFYNSGHIGPRHREVTDRYTHFELESIASAFWGYMHFPVTVRYARTLGLPTLGMTGKFHTWWGDFHSFKNEHALKYECFRMLAMNAMCCIGDQLHPSGKICPTTYELIGKVYSEVEKKEPWCRQARPMTEIGVFNPEEFEAVTDVAKGLDPGLLGVGRMLQEGAHQFDIIDSQSDFNAYKVLVLPDSIIIHDALAAKLEAYLRQGGKLIATYESGLNAAKDAFALKALGVSFKSPGPVDHEGKLARGRYIYNNDFAEYVIPRGAVGKGLPATEHVMYLRGMDIEAVAGSEVLCEVTLPYFDRTFRHFCSHQQSPSSGKPGQPAIVRKGNAIYFSHPLFTTYNTNAAPWCKRLFLNAIDMLLGEPLLRHDGPSTVQTALNEQPAEKRLVLHVLHYIPERRCVNIDVLEDVIPLYNLKASVRVAGKVKSVQAVPDNRSLSFTQSQDRVEIVIDKVEGHQMVSINL